MEIFYRPRFKRMFKKLSKEIQLDAVEALEIFKANPFRSSLKTHKLHGALSEYWAFDVNNKIRIMFEFSDNNEVWLYKIGDHSIYE